mmetsp:Transcript_10524/g.20742  ORF Transcript_10524/g.20742 Transcript_10524/m.20742 type:complete len:205 (+) Transcript_10524:573-1187(+)
MKVAVEKVPDMVARVHVVVVRLAFKVANHSALTVAYDDTCVKAFHNAAGWRWHNFETKLTRPFNCPTILVANDSISHTDIRASKPKAKCRVRAGAENGISTNALGGLHDTPEESVAPSIALGARSKPHDLHNLQPSFGNSPNKANGCCLHIAIRINTPEYTTNISFPRCILGVLLGESRLDICDIVAKVLTKNFYSLTELFCSA